MAFRYKKSYRGHKFVFARKEELLEFKRDLKTKRAVERHIEIIGEAVNRIAGVAPDIEISNSRKIIATRNRIIHGYDSVSEEII